MKLESISTGFLTGNLFSDETGIDIDASITKYDEKLTEAIQEEFPDASVTVSYQNASGCTPFNLQTSATFDIDCTDDAWDSDIESEVIQSVDDIAETLYQDFDSWVVLADEDEDEDEDEE